MALSFTNVKVAMDVVLQSGHVPNIIGLQGIGKSDLVREYVNDKGYAFKEITCSLVQEGDMAMPYISKMEDGREVHYAINTIITSLQDEVIKGGYTHGVLFLDEFNRARSNVQSEPMNLVLQREIAGYKLDSRIMVVLAMNPSSEMAGYEDTDYSVSFSDSAILGRVCSLHLNPILSDWLDYGSRVRKDGNSLVHAVIMKYLQVNPQYFTTKEVSGSVNNTPRGWSRASDILYSYEQLGISNKQILRNLFDGTLDSTCVDSLVTFYQSFKGGTNLYKVADSILDGSFNLANGYKKLTEVELDKMFRILVEKLYAMGGISSEVAGRFVDFILLANSALSYSWMSLLSTDYADLYEGLIEDNTNFSNYALKLLSSVKGRERGGFNGK